MNTDSYARGFVDKCAEHGVDPEQLVKTAQASRFAPKLLRRLDVLNDLFRPAGARMHKPVAAPFPGEDMGSIGELQRWITRENNSLNTALQGADFGAVRGARNDLAEALNTARKYRYAPGGGLMPVTYLNRLAPEFAAAARIHGHQFASMPPSELTSQALMRSPKYREPFGLHGLLNPMT
jgi:hypothetical protein